MCPAQDTNKLLMWCLSNHCFHRYQNPKNISEWIYPTLYPLNHRIQTLSLHPHQLLVERYQQLLLVSHLK